jgi:F0F1-type ATP synthase membrane subunit b/b'
MFLFARTVYKGFFILLLLSDLVESHKSLIVKSLQDVESRLTQAELNLSAARNNLETSKLKSQEIRNQAFLLSSQTKTSLLLEAENDIKRLKSLSLTVIRIEEDKSVSEMV